MLGLLFTFIQRLFWRSIEQRIKSAAGSQHPLLTAAGLLAIQAILA